MPDQSTSSEPPGQSGDSKASKPPVDKKLDRLANEAAERAAKTEQRYDQEHNIFTK